MKNFKNKIKNMKGVTLISLVVTIIILIIISSVSIGIILGNNGLIDRAKTAKSEYQNSVDEENKRLEEIYSSLLVATDGTVTIDYETLANTIIKLQNPTGSIITFMADNAPDGYLACNGQEVSRTTYKDLFDIIGTKYGEGDGNTTFNVPDLTGKFLKGSSSAGIAEHAGLPNITGSAGLNGPNCATWWTDSGVSGALGATLKGRHTHTISSYQGSDGNYDTLTFNASKSNSIYGNSTTVTPENISVVYCIKY